MCIFVRNKLLTHALTYLLTDKHFKEMEWYEVYFCCIGLIWGQTIENWGVQISLDPLQEFFSISGGPPDSMPFSANDEPIFNILVS